MKVEPISLPLPPVADQPQARPSLTLFLGAVLGLILAACGQAAETKEPLRRIPLTIAGTALSVEVAATPTQQSRGLMFREHLPDHEGMLFPFDPPRRASFWMRNTRIPLSIAYLDREGTILEIYDMTPFDETSIPSRSEQVAYALEVNRGWFRRHGIAPGDRVLGLPAAGVP